MNIFWIFYVNLTHTDEHIKRNTFLLYFDGIVVLLDDYDASILLRYCN